MNRAIPVLINRSGGTAAALGDGLGPAVLEAFADAGRAIELELVAPANLSAVLRRHAGAPVVVVGGGDGTVSAAASVLAQTSSALGILPLGTRNHLARQLGIPLDLADAARLVGSGQRRRMDLGAAGDRIFVNNASFGIYTRLVRQREAGASSAGAFSSGALSAWSPKWLKTVAAALHVVRHMHAQRFCVTIDGKRGELETPLLFIGNNAYSVARGRLGERDSLDDGELSILAVSARSGADLVMLAARALLGLARPERDFEEFDTAHEIVLEGCGEIEGAFDGELASLALPLRIRILPNALGVITPREVVAEKRQLSARARTDRIQ